MEAEAHALIARLRSRPDDLEAYEALKAHYHYANDFASLSNLIEGFAARADDPYAAASAFHEAARTVSYYLDDQLRAIELLELALDRAPDHAESAEDLARLIEATGEVRVNVQSLERSAARLANHGADPTMIATVHYQLGELWEKTLERIDKAVIHYRSAFELDPEHVPAMFATREIYRRSGDNRTAAQVYELEIAAERDPTRAVMLLRELSHLRRETMNDVDGGIHALDRALSLSPHDSEVTYELAGVLLARAAALGDTPAALEDRRRAAALLVRLAQASSDETQIAFLESALDAAPDSDEALSLLEVVAPAARAEARLPLRYIRYVALAPNGPNVNARRARLAEAYVASGQVADAIACLEPVLASGDTSSAQRLIELYTIAGRPEDAARTRLASLASLPREERVAVLEQTLASARPGSDEARAAIDGLLDLDPAHPVARAARLADMRARGDHAALHRHYLELANDGSRSVTERSEAWREIATLAEGPLADPDLANRARSELLSLSPGDRDARAKLKQSMRMSQKWNDLAGILVWEATQEETEDLRRAAVFSLDELTERANLDPARAIEALTYANSQDPRDASLRDKLLARLTAAGRMRDALPLVEAKAEATDDQAAKLALYDQAARIREEIGDIVGAIAVLERWLAIDPSADAAANRALSLADRSGDPLLLETALERESNRATGDERARWLLRLADLRETRLGAIDRAIAALEAATEAAANDERIRLELEATLQRAKRYEDRLASMQTRVEKQATEDQRIELLREIAVLSERELEDQDAAAVAFQAIRAIREDEPALDWLLARARRGEDGSELISLLAAKLALEKDPSARAEIGLDLASRLDESGQREQARTVLESVRAEAPDPKPILEKLAFIYHAERDAAGLAAAYAELLDHETDDRRAIEIAKSLHDIATKKLDSEALTAKALAKWSALAPSEIAPLAALVDMHVRAGRERDAADALVELGKRLDSPSEAEAKLLEASQRYEAAQDLEAAMAAARLAGSIGFGSVPARDRLLAVAELANRFDVVLEIAELRVREAEARGAGARGTVIDELLACATIARQRLADTRRAEQYMLRASELAEGHGDLVAKVESFASSLDRDTMDAGASLERALVKRLLDRAGKEEGEPRIAKIVRATRMLAEAIGDIETAYRVLVESSAEESEPELLEALVDVATRGAKVNELERLLQERFDESVDGDVARRLLETRATLLERVNRAADAAAVLQRLYGMRGTPELRERLLATLAKAGRHDERVNVLEQAIRRTNVDAERVALGKAVASIWEVDLGNRLEATDAWKRVMRWAPSDPEAALALDRLGMKRTSMAPPPPAPAAAPPPAPAPAPAAAPSQLAEATQEDASAVETSSDEIEEFDEIEELDEVSSDEDGDGDGNDESPAPAQTPRASLPPPPPPGRPRE